MSGEAPHAVLGVRRRKLTLAATLWALSLWAFGPSVGAKWVSYRRMAAGSIVSLVVASAKAEASYVRLSATAAPLIGGGARLGLGLQMWSGQGFAPSSTLDLRVYFRAEEGSGVSSPDVASVDRGDWRLELELPPADRPERRVADQIVRAFAVWRFGWTPLRDAFFGGDVVLGRGVAGLKNPLMGPQPLGLLMTLAGLVLWPVALTAVALASFVPPLLAYPAYVLFSFVVAYWYLVALTRVWRATRIRLW